MSTTPTPGWSDPQDVKADPKRPYKMYAAIVAAFLASFLTTTGDDLPAWAVGLITAAVSAIAVYVVPNPKVYP